jgi:hypothetical protein
MTDIITKQSEQISQKNLVVAINHKYFTTSFLEIVNLFQIKSSTFLLTYENDDLLKNRYFKLQTVCEELQKGFNTKEVMQGKIIKKIYRVLTQNVDKLCSLDVSLFFLKNDKNETVTIIPGLDMGLIVKNMTDEDLSFFWPHVYMLYISTVNMVSLNNNLKKEGKIWEVMPELTKKVLDAGLIKDDKLLNPFIGVSSDSTEYNVDEMFTNVNEFKTPDGLSLENILSMTGMDKFMNFDQLNDQLKNISDMDISSTSQSITQLLGGDSDVSDICGSLMEGIVSEMKANPDKGLTGIFDVAKNVTDRIGSSLDKDKMKKTVQQLSSFMSNSEEKLKNLKDEQGNPVGENIMKQMEGPLKMLQSMESGKDGQPDMAKLMSMMKQFMPTQANKKI